jgi:Yip1-like protein
MTLTEGIDLSQENPFFTIGTRPRATIRGIVDRNPTFRVLPLAMAFGILQVLQIESLQNLGDRLSVPAILLIAVLFGPPGGLISLYVGAWFIAVTCRPFGGRADSTEVRAALAWSSVPLLATVPLWIMRIVFLGREMFTAAKPSLYTNPALIILVFVTVIPEFVLSIWWLVVTLKALGEVQRFSAWKALGSVLVLVSIFILMVVLGIIAYFVLPRT